MGIASSAVRCALKCGKIFAKIRVFAIEWDSDTVGYGGNK